MKTLTVDEHKRVRIPMLKPHQVFTYSADDEGVITLIPLNETQKERFPPGSLEKYFTSERDLEEALIFAGCVKGPE